MASARENRRKRREERFQRNEARKDKRFQRRQARRQQKIDARQSRIDSRRAGRLERIEARQSGRTSRVQIRNDRMMANVRTRQEEKTRRHVSSVENGFNPDAWKEEGMKVAGKAVDAVGNYFGGGKKNGFEDFEPNGGGVPSNRNNSTGIIIGAVIGVIVLIGSLFALFGKKKKKVVNYGR